MNVSSIIVRTSLESNSEVLTELKNADYCEVHFSEACKIVVTVEGVSTDEEIAKLKIIEKLKGVISAELVYAYSENELDSERQNIEMADVTPNWLNEDIDARNIRYGGDLKKRDIKK